VVQRLEEAFLEKDLDHVSGFPVGNTNESVDVSFGELAM
jgi:hypothetical protein